MKRSDITVHGFRSTFRDWAAETTNFPNFVVEMALAHVVANKVEGAYRRGDLFAEKTEADGDLGCLLRKAAVESTADEQTKLNSRDSTN